MQKPFIVRNRFNYYFTVKDSAILLFSEFSVRFGYNFSSIWYSQLNYREDIKSEKQREWVLRVFSYHLLAVQYMQNEKK